MNDTWHGDPTLTTIQRASVSAAHNFAQRNPPAPITELVGQLPESWSFALGRAGPFYYRHAFYRSRSTMFRKVRDNIRITPRLRPVARRAARHHQPRLIGRRLAAAACLRSDEEGWLSSLQTLSFFGSRCTTRRESVLCALLVPSVGVQ